VLTDKNENLKRALKPRHMSMIAIGGAIGTGLFLAMGDSLSSAGPGGALAAYGLIGVMVYFVMTSLGEMATYMPVPGAFETYATKFFDPALGFALGWNYWYYCATTVAAEMVASAIIMKFWFPHSNPLIWCSAFIVLLFLLNMFSVKAYGESEFWFASIKVVAIIVFLIVGVLMIIGILGGKAVGFENWVKGDAPFVGGVSSIVAIFMIAGFSFQGTELIGVTAGESEDPEKNIPRAVKTVFWRIMLFYIGTIIVIGFLIPYTDPNLLKTGVGDIAVSPFTLVFKRLGLAFTASIMNAVILSSVLSCGNSSLYASSRLLYAMSVEGKAPKIFAKITKSGVPITALCATTLFVIICFLSGGSSEGSVYVWLLSAAGLAGFISWMWISCCHLRFRKAMRYQGKNLNELKYKAKMFPAGPIFAVAVCIIVIVGQNIGAFTADVIDWRGIILSYIGVPLFIALYFIYKFVKKTKIKTLNEVDLSIGLAKNGDKN
jgi:lysine-specific permease